MSKGLKIALGVFLGLIIVGQSVVIIHLLTKSNQEVAKTSSTTTEKSECKSEASSVQQTTNGIVDATKEEKYVDYRQNYEPSTGKTLETAADVDQIDASETVKNFLKDTISGKNAPEFGGPAGSPSIVVLDQIYGEQASFSLVGPVANYYYSGVKADGKYGLLYSSYYGQKDCKKLVEAKVSPKLWNDGKCGF